MTFQEIINSDNLYWFDVNKNPQAAAMYKVRGVPTVGMVHCRLLVGLTSTELNIRF